MYSIAKMQLGYDRMLPAQIGLLRHGNMLMQWDRSYYIIHNVIMISIHVHECGCQFEIISVLRIIFAGHSTDWEFDVLLTMEDGWCSCKSWWYDSATSKFEGMQNIMQWLLSVTGIFSSLVLNITVSEDNFIVCCTLHYWELSTKRKSDIFGGKLENYHTKRPTSMAKTY